METSKKKKTGREKLPTAIKKQVVVLFVEAGIIDALGGKKGVRNLCYESLKTNSNGAT